MEVQLPHTSPLKFAKQILFSDSNSARVVVEFDAIPSLAMLIESAAQSTAALASDTTSVSKGYLVAMKNSKLHNKPTKIILEAEVSVKQVLGTMKIIEFKVYENTLLLADGSLTLVLQEVSE